MTTLYKSVEESQIILSELMLPSHANFNGKIHGGYILSLMDQIAFACASKHSKYYCVTASVETVNFLQPIEVGELTTLKASVNYVGKTSMIIGIRVEAENIHTGAKKHCNSSYFTMVAKDDDGNGMKVPGLILDSKTEIRRFLRIVQRLEAKKQHKTRESNFKIDDHIQKLKDYNVIVALKGYK